MGHTIGFIVTASCFLILLFYVDLNRVISVLYCISAGSAVANVAARPFAKLVLPRFVRQDVRSSQVCVWQISLLSFSPFNRSITNARIINSERYEVMITGLDAISTGVGLGMGLWWLFVRHTASYAWILQVSEWVRLRLCMVNVLSHPRIHAYIQDIMGICLCILFLTLVRFPNIRVATVLLSLAFFYDIFFVFLSPIFFHESVMIKVCMRICRKARSLPPAWSWTDFSAAFSLFTQVATGGAPKADPTYCEKYPSDRDCKTREDLPMLLVLPRIHDYQGGFTMLGLGDIILPGLLVAFAARYDR